MTAVVCKKALRAGKNKVSSDQLQLPFSVQVTNLLTFDRGPFNRGACEQASSGYIEIIHVMSSILRKRSVSVLN